MKISGLKLAFFSFAVLTLIFLPLGSVHSAPNISHPRLSSQPTLADLPPEAQLAILSSIQRGKLTASDGATSNQLGWAIAISGDGNTIVVGAPYGDGSVADQGAAYVFVRSGGWATMTQTAKLTNGSGSAYDCFGCSLAVSANGSTIVVGAFKSSINTSAKEGAAFVYVRPLSGWATTSSYTARLASTHRATQDFFGYSVSISADGNTIVVGAYKYDDSNTDQGGAYVFVKPVSGWGGGDPMYQSAELLSSNPATNDYFGYSVSISADASTIIIGAPNVDDGLIVDEGTAYVFIKPIGGWIIDMTQFSRLLPAGAGTGDLFGSSVSINSDGSIITVGAPYSSSEKGQAYVFIQPGGGWMNMSQNAKLNASDGAANDWFGTSISISGDGNTIVAGANGADVGANADQGAAYTFSKPLGGWAGNLTQTSKQTASDGAAGDGFGFSVSVNRTGEAVVAGASNDDVNSKMDQGSAYEFAIIKKVTLYSIGSQDGWILESSELSNMGGILNAGSSTFNVGDDATRKQYLGILSFNTGASLPDGGVITSITLKVQKSGVAGGGDPLTIFAGFMVDVKKGFFGSSAGLQAGDFQSPANKTIGPFNPALISSWYSVNLTASKAYINKLVASGGLTQVRLRFKLDDNNNPSANYLSLFSGNAPAVSRPKLIIQYYVP